MKIVIEGANRAISGGSWYYSAFFSRMAYRRRISVDCKCGSYGFRIIRRIK